MEEIYCKTFTSSAASADVPAFEESYADLDRLRNDYDVVTQHYLEYLEALVQFFDPQKHTVNRASLHNVFAAERYSPQLITAFGQLLTTEVKGLKRLDDKLLASGSMSQTTTITRESAE